MKNSTDNKPDHPKQGKPCLRVVFAGTPEFAAHHLKALLDMQSSDISWDVIAVYTQPDRPAGRGKKLAVSPVKTMALEHQIPVYQPVTLKDPEAQQALAEHKADLMVVVAYGLLLPKVVLETPRLGCINVHASLLPRWRGAAPIQRAIAAGDQVSGVTIMQMDVGLDTGDMLVDKECAITDTDTAASLHDKLATIGAPALIEAIQQLASDSAKPQPQDDALSTYADKISKQEALIDWSLDAESLSKRVRAFNPFPVAFSNISGERVRIWNAFAAKLRKPVTPGMIIEASSKGITVACGQGALVLDEIQLPGKKRLSVSEVLNSRAELFAPGKIFDLGDVTH